MRNFILGMVTALALTTNLASAGITAKQIRQLGGEVEPIKSTITRCVVIKGNPLSVRDIPGGKQVFHLDNRHEKIEVDGAIVDIKETKNYHGEAWSLIRFDSVDINEGWILNKFLINCYPVNKNDR